MVIKDRQGGESLLFDDPRRAPRVWVGESQESQILRLGKDRQYFFDMINQKGVNAGNVVFQVGNIPGSK